MKFEHIQGKKNVVADAIYGLRMYGLYQDNNNEEFQLSLEDAVENIIEEIHHINSTPTATTYNKIDKLKLKLLQIEQWWDNFCKMNMKEIKAKLDPNIFWDENSILRKAVKLRYSIVSTIVVPRKLANIIILEFLEFHNGKGHQEISHTVNLMCRYFWWIGMQRDIHQHVNTCKLCIQFLPKRIYMQPMHLEIPLVPFTSCVMDSIGQFPTTSKGNRFAVTFICLLTSYLITVPLKTKTANEVSMAYIKEILPNTSCSKFILQDSSTEFKMSN